MGIIIRLSEFMKSNNILQKDIAVILGITNQAVSGIFNGKSSLTTKQITLLAAKFPDLDLRWLLTGEQLSKNISYQENDILRKVEESVQNLPNDEKSVLMAMLQSKDKQIETLLNLLSEKFTKEFLPNDDKNGDATKKTPRVKGFGAMHDPKVQMILKNLINELSLH